jgi:3-hydroxyacyl-CoA dehydrogenase/enoyl-CoA hydratase/3-hydroxybutyryl-CoA epimerase
MVLVMINEAARVLDERVVDAPEDVDFGMIMGTGWAPFRGGPLRYADTLGADQIVTRLEVLARDVGTYFAPSERLRAMAKDGRPFYGATGAKAAPDRTPPPKPAEPRLISHQT